MVAMMKIKGSLILREMAYFTSRRDLKKKCGGHTGG
jgi:hypothetical protein